VALDRNVRAPRKKLGAHGDCRKGGREFDCASANNRATFRYALPNVSKRWFSITDTYGVDVQEGEDDVLILACTVVIDMICHDDHKRS
jgi:uncharacterized protein YxjI